MKFFKKMIRDNEAATAIEYGLIAALIAVAGIAAFSFLGQGVSGTFNGAANAIDSSIKANNANTAPKGS